MDIRFGDSAATGSDQRRILIRDHGREPERDEFSSGRLIACADNPRPHPDEARSAVSKDGPPAPQGPHGSPGDAEHRPETREGALLTMRGNISLIDQTAVERRQELVVE